MRRTGRASRGSPSDRRSMVPEGGRRVRDVERMFSNHAEAVADTPADIAPQSRDIVFRHLATLLVGRSLRPLGINALPAIAVLPTDLPDVSVRARVVDCLLAQPDGSQLHLEFQSTFDQGDLARFLVYDAHLYERHGSPIRTVVTYTGGVREAPSSLNAGCLRYQVANLYLSMFDGDARLAALKRRAVAAGLDADGALDVALLVLMRHDARRPFEVALEAARLTEALPSETRRDCLAAVLGFSERYLTEPEFARVLEVDALARRMSELIAEGEAKGRAEGEAKGKAEDVLLILAERFGDLPQDLAERVRHEQDLATLTRWMVLALRAATLTDFRYESGG